MHALIYDQFQTQPELRQVPDPSPTSNGVVIKVETTGLCRSDWHGWMGHDPDITPPHVPGHEFAGIVVATGKDVVRVKTNDRVTLPFVCGCGHCPQCIAGHHQVCDHQFQPGFTHWGSFAEYVAVDYADINIIVLPDAMDFETATSLGCRFATSFRAVTAQGNLSGNQWVAVHGCGGVGLSAIMIAAALDARVIAVDINDTKLARAKSLGAVHVINTTTSADVASEIRKLSQGGVHLSIDALGSTETCINSLACLRKRGRHVQVGLMHGQDRATCIPMAGIIANELELVGSHGMAAHEYPAMLDMIADGRLKPKALVSEHLTLYEAAHALVQMDRYEQTGIAIVSQLP